MSSKMGKIVLMGSGELTATMVEVHKQLLSELAPSPKAVFLDTPAGFQTNCDQISERAIGYFRSHVQQTMTKASYKSSKITLAQEAELAFHTLREADYILIGPGSPTYAVSQWRQTSIPAIFIRCIERGGCLVAASAAALTVGRFTLPVYEIYKVGQDLYWMDGMNILAHFGFNLVVIPHWNNAEGGTHDTRFCFMGESRLNNLESLLPDDVSILGLDEHTACEIDLEKNEAVIKGIGCVVLRQQGFESTFHKGDRFHLDVFRGKQDINKIAISTEGEEVCEPGIDATEDAFWNQIHATEEKFKTGLDKKDPKGTANAVLTLDSIIWRAQQDLENEEAISQAREIIREMIVLLGTAHKSSKDRKTESLAPVVEALLSVRERFRDLEKWEEADAIRTALSQSGIIIEDTAEGSRWRLV